MSDPRKNAEGYSYPTAFYGLKDTIREENETDKKAAELIKVLKFIIRSCGFELTERIKIRHVKSGRDFK